MNVRLADWYVDGISLANCFELGGPSVGADGTFASDGLKTAPMKRKLRRYFFRQGRKMPRPPARAVYNVGPFALRGDNFSGVTIFRRAPESIGIPTVRRMEESDRRNRRKRTLDYSNRYYIATFWKFLAEDRDENHTRVVYALQTDTHTDRP